MNAWSRRIHRGLAVVFTASVVLTVIALLQAEPVIWMSYIPLLPLALLFFTGAYMFVLPYRTRRRVGRDR